MTHKLGRKGQVVIPKAIREQIGIEPGDEIAFEPVGDEVRLRRAEVVREDRIEEIRALRGIWKNTPGSGTEELMKERRAERAREEEKAGRYGVGRP